METLFENYSILAEQSFLGSLILNGALWDEVGELLLEDDFFEPQHRLIFRAIRGLAERGNAIDIVSVDEELGALNTFIFAYLGEMAKNTSRIPVDNVIGYAEIIKNFSLLRKLFELGVDISDKISAKKGTTALEIIHDTQQVLEEMSNIQCNGKPALRATNDILNGVLNRVDELFNSKSSLTGLSTGFSDLDRLTCGLQPSDLIILAGRPSMGKTTLALNMIENAANSSNHVALVFSLEMSAELLMMRMLSSVASIKHQKLRTGKLEEDDWLKLTSAVSKINSHKIVIDDSAVLSPSSLRAKAKKVARTQGKIGLIVIDYLQMMSVPGYSPNNRVAEITHISRALKLLAKELNVPVIAISQLNRSLEQRGDKRPFMSDLRDSGSIEQDADLILFVYRDEVYNKNSEDLGIAEVIISKQRNGPTGTVRLKFFDEYCRFGNLEYRGY